MWLENYDAELAEGIIDEMMPKQRQRAMQKASALREGEGYKKIHNFAGLAKGLRDENQYHGSADHIWVDTCCINNESSAELSEAINSMYTWYEVPNACVVLATSKEERYTGQGHPDYFYRLKPICRNHAGLRGAGLYRSLSRPAASFSTTRTGISSLSDPKRLKRSARLPESRGTFSRAH